jgi:hypothetical protein
MGAVKIYAAIEKTGQTQIPKKLQRLGPIPQPFLRESPVKFP